MVNQSDEFEAKSKISWKNQFAELKAAMENYTAQLKDFADCISKLEPDEDLLEPSYGSTLAIDVDLEVISIDSESAGHLSKVVGSNPRFSTRNYERLVSLHQQFSSHIFELVSSFPVGGKEKSTFLDYQEGKPFIPGAKFVVEFQSKRVATHEVNNFNAFNLNFNDELQQIGDWKFIIVGNLSQFTSNLFRSFKVISSLLISPITSLCVVLLSFDFVRVIFNCGRECEDIKRYPCYVGGHSAIICEACSSTGVQIRFKVYKSSCLCVG